MLKASCPACGAELKISNKAIAHVVCEYCRSLSVRQDMNLECMGIVAELQAELTPLQILASGVFAGEPFTLIGAVQKEYDGGYWSEWHADFGAPKSGWLAQAQGRYTMTFPARVPRPFPRVDELEKIEPGTLVRIDESDFTVMDKKTAQVATYCGELPPGAVRPDAFYSIDLAATPDRFATIEIGPEKEVYLFTGQSIEFEDLHLTNLRAIDGW